MSELCYSERKRGIGTIVKAAKVKASPEILVIFRCN